MASRSKTLVSTNYAAQAFAAIGSISRIQVLLVIEKSGDSGLTIGEIQKKTDMVASTLAHHLRFLSEAKLIFQRKESRKIFNHTNIAAIESLSSFLHSVINNKHEGDDSFE